jgi:multiple sugar transport system permease protein
MAILTPIGRRSWQRRTLVGAMYALLVIASATMIYPLGLMLAGSTKSAVDQGELSLLPGFLLSDHDLYAKHVEGIFNESLDMMRSCYDVDAYSFNDLTEPADISPKLVDAWSDFLASTPLPDYAYELNYMSTSRSRNVQPLALRQFKAYLRATISDDIQSVDQATGNEFPTWNAVRVPMVDCRIRQNGTQAEPFGSYLSAFKKSSLPTDRHYVLIEPFYKHSYLQLQYTPDLATYNDSHETHYHNWDEVHLPRRLSGTSRQREDWETFVRHILNAVWIEVDQTALPEFHHFLQTRYKTIQALNTRYDTNYASFSTVPLLTSPLTTGAALADWNLFLEGWKDPSSGRLYAAPVSSIAIRSTDLLFRDTLEKRYGTVNALNAAMGTHFASMDEVLPPQQQWHYAAFLQSRRALRWEFVTRNFRPVIDYIALRGRGLANTVIYCSLAVLSSLIVNPLAAYALSRYKPSATYKLLLFLMVTMAFPPMVTQIPVFLLIRNLKMLNTYWALILPGLANGYSIFLLKGFFDSLPQELYESASLDGAGEFRVFWQITLSLSKPILAVTALNAFSLAYGNFIFALLICQDQRMWTITVWLFQLQSSSSVGVVYASLVLASIPTLAVFMICQNVIMRGIVVPVEK